MKIRQQKAKRIDMKTDYAYVGNELDLFARTINWKRYYTDLISPYIRGEKILEVGAGLGEITKWLCDGRAYKLWLCLEPDKDMSDEIERKINNGLLPSFCNIKNIILPELDEEYVFDTILYVDVLEHIQEDKKELIYAFKYLAKGGILIIVSPAHNWLYTAWDKAIGHYRRYNQNSLLALSPSGAVNKRIAYIDSIGLFASLANKIFLHQSDPKRSQIMFWDRILIPLSRVFDKIFCYRFGKNIIAIWEKQ